MARSFWENWVYGPETALQKHPLLFREQDQPADEQQPETVEAGAVGGVQPVQAERPEHPALEMQPRAEPQTAAEQGAPAAEQSHPALGVGERPVSGQQPLDLSEASPGAWQESSAAEQQPIHEGLAMQPAEPSAAAPIATQEASRVPHPALAFQDQSSAMQGPEVELQGVRDNLPSHPLLLQGPAATAAGTAGGASVPPVPAVPDAVPDAVPAGVAAGLTFAAAQAGIQELQSVLAAAQTRGSIHEYQVGGSSPGGNDASGQAILSALHKLAGTRSRM